VSGFCKDLDRTECGALPSEECTRLAVAAAEGIARRLDAYAKHKSAQNAAALCAALRIEDSAALQACRAAYELYVASQQDVTAQLEALKLCV
jgi:hypothetical protein